MATRRLLGMDPLTKVREMFHVEDPTGKDTVIESVQDVTEILADNKAERNTFDEKAGWKGDVHKVASIPIVVWEELKRKGLDNDNDALLKWLDDPDNRAFRTRPGKLRK